MKRFLNLIQRLLPYKKWLGLSIFFNILMAVFTIAGIPLFIPFFELLFSNKSTDQSIVEGDGLKSDLLSYMGQFLEGMDPNQALNTIIFLIIVVFLLKNIFRYLAHFFIAPVRNGFIMDLRNDLFDHLIYLPVQFFKQNKKGDLLSRMSMDIQETENSILNILETLIKSPLLILGSLIFMFYVSYELTLLVLVLIPFTVLIIGGLSKSLKRQSNTAQKKLAELMSILEEAVTGQKVVKSFNAQSRVRKNFKQVNQSHKSILTRIYWRKDLGSPIAEVLAIGVIALLMYYAARLVFTDKLSPDTFFAFIYAFFIIIEPAKSFTSAYYSYKKGDAALVRLENIFKSKNPIQDESGSIPVKNIKNNIEYKNVSFRYPDSDKLVLNDISFTINKGEKIALVGSSGAGKTTIADLLPRFMDCSSGSISIDGTCIKDIQLEDLRKLIGMVSQDSILFHDTIGNNISFGKEESLQEELEHAAEISNLKSFIFSLEDGFDSIVGEQGSQLSGGQRQRIAIARAVIKNAPILILDEATSSLDSESEQKVQKALKEVMKDKTALIIAHRLSTIQEADSIIVLNEGRIIETGNHQELMNKRGEYYKFVQLQSLKNS